jgi:hypothetical protein
MQALPIGNLVRVIALGLAGAASAVACGGATTGGSGGSGSVTGTVAGTTFTVASEVAAIAPETTTCSGFGGPDGGGQTCTSNGQSVVVVLTNRGDATCAAVQAQTGSGQSIQFANFDALELFVGTSTGTVGTGTFPIGAPTGGATTGAAATFGMSDGTCGVKLDAQAQSGTITLTSLDATSVSGSYDVSFGTQGSFSGSFDVAICTLPDGGVTTGADAGPPVCK